MSYEENRLMGNSSSSSTFRVKQEPLETRTPLGPSSSFSEHEEKPVRVKAELNDVVLRYLDPKGSSAAPAEGVKREEPGPFPAQGPQTTPLRKQSSILQYAVTAPPLFKEYTSADDIQYTPESALKEGVKMVHTLKSRMKLMKLGSKLREEVWARELGVLEGQGSPTTLIAVCGATGAGKSSILNAILDDNIVPTSGMRACTAVVTEISYHNKPTIDADVSFLSLNEWKSELAVLLHDMVDEDGNLKRSTDLKSDAGVAWSKVNAVYPSITHEDLVRMSVDQIITHDHNIANILSTTRKISAKDSRSFSKEIAKYIDSKDQKRSKKEKDKEKSLMSVVRTAAAQHPRNRDQPKTGSKGGDPALWPLIRQVNVRCKAAALSTGAILVDLPGVADANAARNNVAKDYMKKANCVWILAPITRAVDDKTARDLLGDAFKLQLMNGNYDDHAITFIASKCDDISCSEVIRALRLHDDPELEDIENRIDELERDMSIWKKTELEGQKEAKGIEKQLKDIRQVTKEHGEHLDALKTGETFVPRLTGRKTAASSKKRKRSDNKNSGSSKKRRTNPSSDDEDDFMVSDTSEDDSDSDKSDSSDNESDDDDSGNEDSPSGSDEDEEPVTEESLKVKIKEGKAKTKELRATLTRAREKKKEASDKLARFKKFLAKVQREKNAFCSLKRSEFSREVLKEDFRTGLKDLDDAAAEERDPDDFDPTVNLRDYDKINLPVFTCSSRDYIRIQGQVKGDGEPTCFTNVENTGIPGLQRWCHELTIASRSRAARNFHSQLKAFATGVESYVHGISDVTLADRESFRAKWESNEMWEAVPQLASIKGVAPVLLQRFINLIDNCVEELQAHFKDGLEEKCRIGATNAADAAVSTSDEFASSMHWGTYRATLRRHGTWRRDLNAELTLPFTRNIANSWGKVFESDLFAPFEAAVTSTINKLLEEIEDTAAAGLKDRTRRQGDLCLEEARVALKQIIEIVRETLAREQKEVSRCMAPHVQNQLLDGYDCAIEERGRGSVARQKDIFRQYVTNQKNEMFEGGAQVIMDRLVAIANAIGEDLETALEELAKKIEVNISVLWEGARDEPGQAKARQEALDCVSIVLQQIGHWTGAAKNFMQEPSQSVNEDVEME